MRATPRRLTLLAGLVLGLLTVPGAALVATADAWAADGEAPTVTFARGHPPRNCSSEPSVASVSVPEGTGVVVANASGRNGSIYVGHTSVLPIPDGTGVLLVLAVGQHEVRVVLECHNYNQAGPLAVMVTSAAPPPPPPPPAESPPDPLAVPSTATPATAAAPPSTSGNQPAAPNSSADAGPGGAGASTRPGSGGAGAPGPTTVSDPSTGSAAPSVAGTSVPTGSTRAAAAPGPMPAPGVISASPVALVDSGHSKGLRLLAVVATICVLGVTAAIIRAIVRLSP